MADAPFELQEVTVAELARRMQEGEVTARALTDAYLDRIDALDRDGPQLRSVIATNPTAQAAAEELDRERQQGHVRGPLHGIPILVKDNIDISGPMGTSAGSLALREARPSSDAPLVRRLLDAGVVILGKANLSEWANFRSTRSSSGWSAMGGQCRNPYVLDRNPCGSSSGSAVAVSADLCVVAVGTETDGSIMCPASIDGIVGIKPTVGLVRGDGIVPISHTQDTAGPMARTVADAFELLSAMAEAAPGRGLASDRPSPLDPKALRSARIGVARNLAGFHDRVDALFEQALSALRDLGAELVDAADVPHATELEEPELDVLLYEFKADLETYLTGVDGDVPRTLEGLIAFNRAHADEELAFFGQELFEKAAAKGPLTEPAYLEALSTCGRLARDEGLDAAFTAHGVDAIVAPTGAPAWLTDHVNGDHYVGGNTTPAAVAGYPSVTVPMGFVSELPVGLSFIGHPWTEATLAGYAYAFEQATTERRPPRYLPTSEA
ncbi:MAG TPA: amidase [Actinomycetota bacterium]|nr:amidase [Actinomycetota bacterium]